MTASSSSQSCRPSIEPSTQESRGFSQLREVLLGPEQTQLRHLQKQLDDFTLQPDAVSRVLPDAIRLRAQRDQRLLASMIPITQEALSVSIKQSPHLIVDTLAPILGPVIRKATLDAMRGMLQSFNQTLEYSMSWNGLQWRWEAWKTGRPFAEVVLLHTLHFRVEQVFLIHKQTGLLLNHVVAEGIQAQGEEVISGMLTAIQDFVRDSFGSSKEEALESLRIGELTVWVEQGSQAILAGVIRGTPPVELRRVFRETLEVVQSQFSGLIQQFQGDITPFYDTRLFLENCLQAQFVPKPSRISWGVWMLLLMLCGVGGVWAARTWNEHQQWSRFYEAVGKEDGLVITSTKEQMGKTVLYGLRDPLARDPQALLDKMGQTGHNVSFHFQPYLDLTPKFVGQRAESLLAPPQGVSVHVEGSKLILRGEASHSWVKRALAFAPFLPGVTAVDHQGLVDKNWARFHRHRQVLEGQKIFFEIEESRISDEENFTLSSIRKNIQSLEQQAKILGVQPIVEIQGFSSPDGLEKLNWELSQHRAQTVKQALSTGPWKHIRLVAIGKGPEEAILSKQNGLARLSHARRVSFNVRIPLPASDTGGQSTF